MDLSRFRKAKEDEHHAHFKTPEGHEIKIAKKDLDPRMKQQLANLPLHMDEGGEVPLFDKMKNAVPEKMSSTPADAPKKEPGWFDKVIDATIAPFGHDVNSTAQTPGQKIGSAIASAAPSLDPMARNMSSPQLDQTLMQQQGMAQPASMDMNQMPGQVGPGQPQVDPMGQDPFGANAYSTASESGLGMQMAGIQNQAKAESQAGFAQAKAAEANVQALQKQQMDYQQHYQDIDKELSSVVSDIGKGHIDPEHFWANRSGWQKASIFIGLALGGSPQILKDAIDRDVHAQETDLNNKNTVFNAQMKRMGNAKDAADMTRLVQASVYASQLTKAAAQAQSPMAQARAQQAVGHLMSEYAPLAQQLAMRRSVQSGVQGGQPDSSMMVNMMVPKEHQAAAFKELSEAQEMNKAKNNANGLFQQISKIQSVGNRLASPVQSSRQIDALWDPFVAGLSKATAGRFTEQDSSMLNTLRPNLWDNEETKKMKQGRLNKMMDEKMNFPILNGYRIPLPQARYTSEGERTFKLSPPVRR
jgi:hypothetical protein